ncbi:MAG: hypothetical protein HOP07_05070 [Bacteriovoracaceae bacterium]|nr:hypothetical protein [Bacteriovoracaceae bacterium]
MINRLLGLSLVTMLVSTTVMALPIQRKNEKKLYIGSNSTEAKINFNGTVQHISTQTPTITTMKRLIEAQVEHTIGPMSAAQYTAVPKGDHVISNIKILSKNGSTFEIGYVYSGNVVLELGPKTTYDIILAINPETIYSSSFVGEVSPCTDPHYQSEGDFWYFWNPNSPGCKLKKDIDYKIVKAKVSRYENTKLTYPEYHNLPDAKGDIHIHVLFGMDDNTKGRNPLTSGDINAENYRDFRNYLLEKGYTAKKWTAAEVSTIAKTLNGAKPFVETIKKDKIVYRFFFAPSAIDEDSLGFHWFYKDALENSAIMIYGGHSGLGGHLDLDSIEQNLGESIKFNKNKYQIYFFDSCTSYKYYNQMYFDRKISTKDPKGTKKLDIFTNGLSTYFHVMPDSNKAIAIALEKALGYAQTGAGFVSYQSLAKQIDSDNLFGVNGDEDNEAPKKIK